MTWNYRWFSKLPDWKLANKHIIQLSSLQKILTTYVQLHLICVICSFGMFVVRKAGFLPMLPVTQLLWQQAELCVNLVICPLSHPGPCCATLRANCSRRLHLSKALRSELQAPCTQLHRRVRISPRTKNSKHSRGDTMWAQGEEEVVEEEEEGSVIVVVWLWKRDMNGCVCSALKGQPSSQPLSRGYWTDRGIHHSILDPSKALKPKARCHKYKVT